MAVVTRLTTWGQWMLIYRVAGKAYMRVYETPKYLHRNSLEPVESLNHF